MQIHFISDLHLCADRPALTAVFERYLAGPARAAARLYILGDLFEYWAGDDDLDDPLNTHVAGLLADLAESGCQVFFMPGNRDFLIGADFAARARLQLLAEPARIELGNEAVLLCHGDSLCTRDEAYMRLRRILRNPVTLWVLRHLPLSARHKLARKLRSESRAQTRMKANDIVDVTPEEVPRIMAHFGVHTLIHGHTHRPAIHELQSGEHAKIGRAHV